MAPSRGRKTIAWTMIYSSRMIWSENRYPLFRIMRSAIHQIDVLNRDRATVEEIDHQEREALPDDVAEEGRERHEVDVDGEQDQLDRHQDDDDVLAVQEDAEDPERKQDRADRKIVSEPDRHFTHSAASESWSPCPDATLRSAIAMSGVRAF